MSADPDRFSSRHLRAFHGMQHRLYASTAVVLASVTIGSCDQCNHIHKHVHGAQPNPGQVSGQVTVTDRFILAKDARPASVEFDLDGDGRFDTAAGAIEQSAADPHELVVTVQKSYDAPATILITSLLRTSGGRHDFEGIDTQGEVLEIKPADPTANQPPLASFTMSPNPAAPE